MRLFEKVMCLCLFLFAFSFAGCNSTSIKSQPTESKIKDFNFVFNYGVDAKNQLDTTQGQFTKDMVSDPSITTNLKLSEDEMNTIYSEMKKINILDYPDNFNPKSNTIQIPFDTYSIKINIEGKEKNIYWIDKSVSETEEAVQLRKLFKNIQEIIVTKEEFKKLPNPKSHYQ
jgi:hypothetical protein